jgi:hypothetical protein
MLSKRRQEGKLCDLHAGIKQSEIIKRNLIDSGLCVHERARCSHGKPDRRKRKCCRMGHMIVGTGSGCLPTRTVTKPGVRVALVSRNNGTPLSTSQYGSKNESNKNI